MIFFIVVLAEKMLNWLKKINSIGREILEKVDEDFTFDLEKSKSICPMEKPYGQ